MNLQNKIFSAVGGSRYDQWSERKGNKYTINKYTADRTENNVYVAGRGFSESKAETTIRSVLLNVVKTMSVALLVYMMCDHILNPAVAMAVSYIFDIPFTINPFKGYVVLQDSASYHFMVIMTLIKFGLVFAIFRATFRMPVHLAHFRKPLIKEKNIVQSFGISFIVSSALSLLCLVSRLDVSVGYISTNLIGSSDTLLENQQARWFLLTLLLVCMSTFTEVVVHSSAFAVLRQFGDWFAVIYMSVISTMILQDISATPTSFIITFIAGISVVKTESIYIGIVQRIVMSVVMSAPYLFSVTLETESYWKSTILFLTLIIASGFIMLWISGFFKSGNAKKYFNFKRKNIFGLREYISVYFESLLAILVFAICILIFIIGSLVSFNGK